MAETIPSDAKCYSPIADQKTSILFGTSITDAPEMIIESLTVWIKRRSDPASAMWAPYYDVVCQRAKQATICFDRFHVVQHLNRAVDEVRRSMVRKLKGTERALIKGTRFVLLKNPWDLTPKQKQSLMGIIKDWHLKRYQPRAARNAGLVTAAMPPAPPWRSGRTAALAYRPCR